MTHDNNLPNEDKARESASDLAAALNAIIFVCGLDDATRAPLMILMDAAAGRATAFKMADKYLGRRLRRKSGVSIEHGEEASDRADAKRWGRVWETLDAEQGRTGYGLATRLRGGLRGESRETMRRHASTYTVPLVQMAVDVIRRARQCRLRGAKRIEMFQRAAREIIETVPCDYQSEGVAIPKEKRPAHTPESKQVATVTRIFTSHARLVSRAAGEPEIEPLGACVTMLAQIKEAFGDKFDEAVRAFTESRDEDGQDAGVYYLRSGKVLHAEESEFPPFEPSDFEIPETEADGHQLFSKPNKNAGENESSVPFLGTKTDSEEPEIDPVEAAEREAIQAEGCGLLVSEPSPPVSVSNYRYDHGAQALHLASLGFHVFPLHSPEVIGGCSCGKSDCSNVGKHPRTSDGFKAATVDPERIKSWWRKWPLANIGIATGKVSNLLVVDVDPRHGGWQSLETLMHRIGEVFSPTVEAITGDGRHFYFQMPEADIRNSSGEHSSLGKGIDIRANGGYVVAAPSLHASGKRYEWATDEAPLAHVPYGLLRELITPTRLIGFKQKRSNSNVTVQTWSGGAIAEGARNETLFRQAAALRGQGAHESEIFDALCTLNRSCSPPLPEREISKVAASVMRYEPNGRSIFV
jgi:hypothetical protein